MDQRSDMAEARYRWVILSVTVVTLAVVMGQIANGLSIYFIQMQTTEGWGRADIALINTLGFLGLGLGSILMGFAVERIGIRPIAFMGALCMGLTAAVASRATELWQFYLLFFLGGFLGGGAFAAPLMALVGSWFVTGAGLAIGIAAAGQAMGQGLVPFTGAFLVEALGWRNAMLVQGLATVAILLPLAAFLRDPPVPREQAALSDQTPSGLPNSLITGWMALAVVGCCTCMAVPLMHLVPLIQDRGFSAPSAGSVVFVMLTVAIVGRVVFGRLADLIGAIPSYLIASGWQTVLVLGFIFIERLDFFYAYAAIYGFGYAGVMTTLLVTTRNLTAPARRASSLGIVLAFAYLGHGIGGWQGGYFYDQTGGYGWTYANAAIAGALNLMIVSALWLTVRGRLRAATA